jgi:hypothetical protein
MENIATIETSAISAINPMIRVPESSGIPPVGSSPVTGITGSDVASGSSVGWRMLGGVIAATVSMTWGNWVGMGILVGI